jgi:superfamily II helicase
MKELIDSKPSMLFIAKLVDGWKQHFHTDKLGNIIFQNKSTFANVRFTNNTLHEIQHNSRGIENLPEAIKSPDEIWSSWLDPNKQMVVLRNYILIGSNGNYVVSTKDGTIINAIFVVNSSIDKYRKGLPMI